MKKSMYLLLILSLAVSVAHAQSGCGDSPENPTCILALVGSLGAGLAALRARWISRR